MSTLACPIAMLGSRLCYWAQMGHEALFSQTGVDIVTGQESKVRCVWRSIPRAVVAHE